MTQEAFNNIIENMISDLTEASKLEGTELGEYWYALIMLYPRIKDCGSDEFFTHWTEEVVVQHEHLKTNFVIKKREVTKTYTEEYLEDVY